MPLTELMKKQAKAQDKPYVPPRRLPRLSVFPAYSPAPPPKSSTHLSLPESRRTIEPALRDGPLAQPEAVGKTVEHLDLRIRSLGPYSACPLLHRAVGGDPVVRPHAAVGGRLVPRHLRQARILHDDRRGPRAAFLAEGPGSEGASQAAMLAPANPPHRE